MKNLVAIHEAGHAVAHSRLDIDVDLVSIAPKDDTQGRLTGAGYESVLNADAAPDMVLSYLAGYAAERASGQPDEVAELGCESDFYHAQALIDDWRLSGDLAHWKTRAVELMSQPANIEAVRLIAEHLLEHETADCQVLSILVDVADGETTMAEFHRFMTMVHSARRQGAAGAAVAG